MMTKSVLITGASSGIGRAAALGLAARGYRVYGGVRRESDAASLRVGSDGCVSPVILDVTDHTSIQRARAEVEDALAGAALDGLVNNAGIAVAGPLECTPLDDIRRQFDVNVFGMLAVFQAFAPSLRAARGRIVNISSLLGFFSLPYQGPYCASKYALEALSDSMRRELRPFGVRVVLIQPGSVDTPIVSKASDDTRTRMHNLEHAQRTLYGPATERALDVLGKSAERAVTPQRIVQLIAHALETKRPRARYLAGSDAHVVKAATRVLPDRSVDWLLGKLG